jgi:ubiquinone biosynthesis protein
MELTDVSQFVRNAKRFREVVAILAKHGLADGLSSVQLPWLAGLRGRSEDSPLTTEQRIRVAMTELGTTFIKLGQVLSTRPDLVGQTLADELASLRADTPANSFDEVRVIVESDLGETIEKLYATFAEQPIASASIGQVHVATTHQGAAVVVKVQHPGIENRIVNDLEIMVYLAGIAEQHSSRLRQYHPVQTVREFQKTLMQELNFSRELRNMQRFRRRFVKEQGVRFPVAYPELSSRRVLTMERFDGISFSDSDALVRSRLDLCELAARGANLFLMMVFRDGFYHADPHPGNLMVLSHEGGGNRNGPVAEIGVLDSGMVGRVDERLREELEQLLVAAVRQDADRLAEGVIRIGQVPPKFDRAALAESLREMLEEYANQPLNEVDLSRCLKETIEIIRHYQIYLPAKVAMLLKVLIMLEGTSHQLDPRFSLAELIQPYGQRAMMRRFSPKRIAQKARATAEQWQRLLEILPSDAADILHNLKKGEFDVHLEHRKLDHVVNRLVMGILTAALFVGSSLMLSLEVVPTCYGVSVAGSIGCLTAIYLGVRLLRAVHKSGDVTSE